MDGLDAGVLEAPEVDSPELDTDLELSPQDATDVEESETPDGLTQDPEAGKDDPYSTRFGRDYRQYLNTLKQTDPEAAKYVKQARDDYGRAFALKAIAPRGIDEVREKFALLDTLAHGEAKGSEAITAMQQSLQEWDDFDQAIVAGDPKAFERIGAEFDAGLAKLAPTYLDRISKSDPAAYESAILPHVVGILQQSPALQHFNTLIDVLNTTDDPRLDEKTKYQYAMRALGKMSEAFNQMGQKAGEAKAAPVNTQRTELDQERSNLEKERQQHHWNTQIEPKVQQHEKTLFDKLFDPYQKRLKLGEPQKSGAFKAFHQSIISAAQNDKDFQRQYKLYKAQKNPDAAAVSNFINVSLSRYGKIAMDELVKDRYEPFLTGRPKAGTVVAKPGVKAQGPARPNVEVRSVKPPASEIDHRNTPVEWMAASFPGGKQYRLYSGKIVQVRS